MAACSAWVTPTSAWARASPVPRPGRRDDVDGAAAARGGRAASRSSGALPTRRWPACRSTARCAPSRPARPGTARASWRPWSAKRGTHLLALEVGMALSRRRLLASVLLLGAGAALGRPGPPLRRRAHDRAREPARAGRSRRARPGWPSARWRTLVHETLVRIDPGGAPVPALARTWTRAADGREWTLTLAPQAALPRRIAPSPRPTRCARCGASCAARRPPPSGWRARWRAGPRSATDRAPTWPDWPLPTRRMSSCGSSAAVPAPLAPLAAPARRGHERLRLGRGAVRAGIAQPAPPGAVALRRPRARAALSRSASSLVALGGRDAAAGGARRGPRRTWCSAARPTRRRSACCCSRSIRPARRSQRAEAAAVDRRQHRRARAGATTSCPAASRRPACCPPSLLHAAPGRARRPLAAPLAGRSRWR